MWSVKIWREQPNNNQHQVLTLFNDDLEVTKVGILEVIWELLSLTVLKLLAGISCLATSGFKRTFCNKERNWISFLQTELFNKFNEKKSGNHYLR